MEIKPTYVTWEQAKWLKEKGFYVKVEWAYQDKNLVHDSHYKELKNWNDKNHVDCSAPEQWQVVEWLRVNYGIWVYPLPIDDEMKLWQCRIVKGQPFSNLKNTLKIINHGEISYRGLYSPQEAYSAAFDYILNNLI